LTEIAKFETEFVKRTKILLETYIGDFGLSNAINCTLGLIILPNEMLGRSRNPIWNLSVADIPELNYLRIQTFEPIKKKIKNGEERHYPLTLRFLLKKIRNGLAHQNIEPVNTDGLFTGIVIRNYYFGTLDLEIEFDEKELKDFAFFIAEKYLET
jgi:hypothetical protein